MKILKIYNITAIIIIILLCVWITKLQKDLKETAEILQQCTDRYYQEIGK